MNTIKRIGLQLYYNAFIIVWVSLLVTHFAFHTSFKWEFIPTFFFILAVVSCSTSYQLFLPFRIIWWPAIKHDMIKRAEQSKSPLIAYPAVLFIESQGREIFLAGGRMALAEALMAHLKRGRDGLIEAITGMRDAFARSSMDESPDAGERLRDEIAGHMKTIGNALPPKEEHTEEAPAEGTCGDCHCGDCHTT